VVGEPVDVELRALRLGLDLVRVDRSQNSIHLALQQRRHHRRDRHVDHVDVGLLQVVRLEQQRQHRRLRRARRHADLLALEVRDRLDAGLLERHHRVRVRLVDGRDDLHRRALGDELAHRDRVGVRELRAAVGDELRGVARAVALDDRDVEAGVLVVALDDGRGEARVGPPPSS
jgi:hypothetical protein